MATQVVFFGSSEFSIVVLNKLLNAKCQLLAVVTTPDAPIGRHLKLTPNPVKVFAQKHGVPIATTMNYKLITNNHHPVGLVAAYGKIIPQSAIDLFHGQIYNIHPSLLPRYRGPSPLQQQILDGISETGVTIIQLDSQVDHGPIVAQAKDKIYQNDTTVTLGVKLFSLGTDLFLKFLPEPNHYHLEPQNDVEASFTHKLTRQDGFVPWEQFQPEKLDRQFRAFSPWPGVWTLTPKDKRLKLVALQPQVLVQLEGKTPQKWS